MSWTDTCGVCDAHRADCNCILWDNVDGKYSKGFSNEQIKDIMETYNCSIQDAIKILEKTV